MSKRVLRSMLMDLASLYQQEQQLIETLNGIEIDRFRGLRGQLENVRRHTVTLGRDVLHELNRELGVHYVQTNEMAQTSQLPSVLEREVGKKKVPTEF